MGIISASDVARIPDLETLQVNSLNRVYVDSTWLAEQIGVVPIRSITASATLTDSDHVVLADATSGAITVTLPGVTSSTGRVFHIKKTDSSANAVTIDGASAETIDGAATEVIGSQWTCVTVVCDGTEWFVI